jgi:hypothetical protein
MVIADTPQIDSVKRAGRRKIIIILKTKISINTAAKLRATVLGVVFFAPLALQPNSGLGRLH